MQHKKKGTPSLLFVGMAIIIDHNVSVCLVVFNRSQYEEYNEANPSKSAASIPVFKKKREGKKKIPRCVFPIIELLHLCCQVHACTIQPEAKIWKVCD